MSMTHDYLDYLNEKVGISPANSQEELQAAEVISRLMGQHDVEVHVEDFSAPSLGGVVPAVISIAMFLGVIVSGVGVLPLTIVGLLLAAVPTVLAVMRMFGREVSLSVGPSAQSQNVVAVHRATGPLVTKGNRPIVIVAHYDSPRENFLVSSPLAPYLPLAARLSVPCSYAVALCAFVQLLGFIPSPARIVFWIVGIVASLPAVLGAVGAIAERTAPCTEGANDNKSSVAALLGVLENVRPSGLVPRERPEVEEAVAPEAADEAADLDEPVEEAPAQEDLTASLEPEPVLGVRRGAEVLRELGILPESCEIEYVEPVARAAAPAPAAASAEAPAPAGQTAPLAPAEPAEAPADATEATREDLLSTGRFSIVMDEEGRGVGPKDSSGLTNLDDALDPDATQPTQPTPRPEAPADPEWGKSSYRPTLSSVARRASLFDLPDPSESESDPFADDPGATRVAPTTPRPAAQQAPEPLAPAKGVAAPEPIATISSERPHPDKGKKNPLSGLIGRLRRQAKAEASDAGDGWLGGADPDSDSDDVWRGGAAPRAGLRLVEDEEAPSEEELREAVLSLGDDALVAHDVWFVALGASSLDHAGMRAFLRQHRSEVRGCFVVNLDCVGAGSLSLLKNEGLHGTRRADRRISRLLLGAASDLHVQLDQRPCEWQDTDATQAMRSSLRSVTIRGVDANGLPALSHTPQDVPENVSGDQAAQVAEIVTEMIRRS